MKAFQLFVKLTAYYALIGIVILGALNIWPELREYLPIGGVEALISQPDANPLEGSARSATAQQVGTFGESLFWLSAAIVGAFLTALPVSWVYMGIRTGEEYDQSLISTILILPVVVTIYQDRSFTFVVKTPPAAVLLKRAAGIAKASAVPHKDKIGKVSRTQVREIAQTKLVDLNTDNVDSAMRIIEGTARSMGIEVV